jgi:hypothetical protein
MVEKKFDVKSFISEGGDDNKRKSILGKCVVVGEEKILVDKVRSCSCGRCGYRHWGKGYGRR